MVIASPVKTAPKIRETVDLWPGDLSPKPHSQRAQQRGLLLPYLYDQGCCSSHKGPDRAGSRPGKPPRGLTSQPHFGTASADRKFYRSMSGRVFAFLGPGFS